MHKFEIVFSGEVSEFVRKFLDSLMEFTVDMLRTFGVTSVAGAVLYNIPAEKED